MVQDIAPESYNNLALGEQGDTGPIVTQPTTGSDSEGLGDPHDPVAHPSHYTTLGAQCSECHRPIECIDVVKHMNYSRGAAMKYIWRAGSKGSGADAEIEDLRKAMQYLQFEIDRLKEQ